MTVKVYDPKISVILKKNIGRSTVSGSIAASQRFQGTKRTIDLTPYLGEHGSVTTSKSVREPAGMFTIVMADQMNLDQFESMYGIIEPMDIIEIRMARNAAQYKDSGLKVEIQGDFAMPIVMRGFVTTIGRTETMTENGPVRSVTITGQDYGKILQIMQIAYLPNEVTGQNLLTSFNLFVNYGIGAKPDQDASEFMQDVIDKVVTDFLNKMRASISAPNGGSSPVQNIVLDASVTNGLVSPFGLQQWPGGTIYTLMLFFGDVGPWNELFVEDREGGVYLVYRPNPFKDVAGNLIQEGAKDPGRVDVTDDDVVSLSYQRSDEGVFNYYWVDYPGFALIDGKLLQVSYANAGTPNQFYIQNYQNISPSLYGFRRMELSTKQGPRFDGQPESSLEQSSNQSIEFIAKKRQALIDQNHDNIVFESGSVTLKGNEAIKAGKYLRLTRGSNNESDSSKLRNESYVVSVQHNFNPFRSFTTTVQFERGTGFVERVQRNDGVSSPYLAEIGAGGVYE